LIELPVVIAIIALLMSILMPALAFLDWSVRNVGLKELWTFRWHKTYRTAGSWTTAGGVMPTDWPEWMRRFKDY
jgi:hypothetical protein